LRCDGLYDPAAVAVFDEGGGGGLNGGVLRDFGESAAGFWCSGPAGNAFNLILISDGILRGVAGVVGYGAGDGGDVEVSEAEVAVARLIGVGGPGGVAFVGEVVEVNPFGSDEEAFLLFGSASEQASVGKSIEVAGAVVFCRIGFGGHFDRLRPDAFVFAGVGIVDGGFELGRVDFFFACGGKKSENGKGEHRCKVSAHSKDLKRVGCRGPGWRRERALKRG
jgi:hypothetical protein